MLIVVFFFFSSRRRHTRCLSDWISDVCSSDLRAPSIRARLLQSVTRGVKRGRRSLSSEDPVAIMGASEVSVSFGRDDRDRSEEHTSELQSLRHLVCRLLLEKNKSISNGTQRTT